MPNSEPFPLRRRRSGAEFINSILTPMPFGNWQWQEPQFGKERGPDKQDPPAETEVGVGCTDNNSRTALILPPWFHKTSHQFSPHAQECRATLLQFCRSIRLVAERFSALGGWQLRNFEFGFKEIPPAVKPGGDRAIITCRVKFIEVYFRLR